MRKLLLQISTTIVCGYLFQLFLPFWAMALAGFAAAVLFTNRRGISSFAAGFLGGFLLWGGYALWTDLANDSRLSSMLGELFQVSGSYLPYATALLGGLLAGFGALSGCYLRRVTG